MRIILHADLNSFFASCEQQDSPELRGKPVGVVQDSGKRSVIIGSSKEAKKLGIGTGMPIWEAAKICPEVVTVPARFDRYIDYSRRFRKILQYYSDGVEVFSIDELFVDLSQTAKLFGNLESIGRAIKDRLRVEVGSWFTCSIGIAPNKMLAKLGSSSKKPDGLVIVEEKDKLDWLDQFELWHICGIGERIQKRLNRLGIYTIKQLRQAPVGALKKEFGIMGEIYSLWGHGEDYSPVTLQWEKEPEKSFGNQLTLSGDLTTQKEINKVFLWLVWQVANRMREKNMAGKTVSLALRGTADRSFIPRFPEIGTSEVDYSSNLGIYQQYTPGSVCATAHDIYEVTKIIYKKSGWNNPVRFVGISVSNLIPLPHAPLSLFVEDVKREKLALGADKIAAKYGPWYLRPAALLNQRLKETVYNGFTKRF